MSASNSQRSNHNGTLIKYRYIKIAGKASWVRRITNLIHLKISSAQLQHVSLNPVCTKYDITCCGMGHVTPFIEMAHLLRRLVSCSRNPTISTWETTQIDKIIQSHEEQLDIRAGHDTDSSVRPIAQCHCDGTVATAILHLLVAQSSAYFNVFNSSPA